MYVSAPMRDMPWEQIRRTLSLSSRHLLSPQLAALWCPGLAQGAPSARPSAQTAPFRAVRPQAEACGPRRNPSLRLGGRLPERICPVGPLANRHDGCGFGIRPGQHCHSPLNVPMRYARCRVAVYGALSGTFTAEWQCTARCRSLPGVLVALPLASERSDAARSTPSGSVRRAAQHAHHRVAV